MLAPLDRLVQVAQVVVGVLRGHRLRLGVGEVLDALVGLEVVLDPELLAAGVDPHEGVAAVAVHVPPGPGYAPVGHEERHLVADSGDSVQKSHCMLLSRRWVSARRFWEWMKSGNFEGSRMKKIGVLLPTMS